MRATISRPQRGLRPGTRLGRYCVVRRIGGGGMAELYLARLDGPNRFVKPVALKLMHAHLTDTPEFVGMFMREARIAASLQHPQIVQVLDVGEYDGEYFLALEYVHGLDLRRVLAERRGVPLPLGAALRIVLDIATALHHAHSLCDGSGRPLGIVHRDVSPSNILIAYDGAVKLTDFGIAHMTEQTHVTATGALKGKPGYMSPEQCLQEHIDARSDVFALGVVLYELTTGRAAFPGDMIATMNRILDGRYTAPGQLVRGYPPALATIVARALAPRAEQRYPSAAALRAAIDGFARQQPGLDTGTEGLVALLTARFGAAPQPDLDTPALTVVMPTTVVDSVSPMLVPANGATVLERARPRHHRLGVGALGVLAGGLLGWQIARAGGTSAAAPGPLDAATAPHVVEAIAPARVVADAAPRPSSGSPLPVQTTATPTMVAPVVVPIAADPVAAGAVGATATTAAAAQLRIKRARAKRRVAAPPHQPTTTAPTRSADAMLPRSAR
ncbi:MAG: serine/threonine protein kinase [Deltaproteobacteria bacterium]|nr:serine/threonine protein kinase [Deltaproteobacteria bacterium]MBK8717083.1 serine/threonine protein kinase [Deltaproteobacteria bacterium]MBP7286394.1 serine/threonine protein kinase [Nannocystaceae bacterium]